MVFGSVQVSEEAGVRYLHFGSDWIQGAMRIARPYALELEYTREMMAPLLLRPDPGWPRRVLLVGLGAGSLTKFLYRHRPEARLTVVEINPEVLAVARQCFKLPEDPARLAIEIGCGADFMAANAKRYDLILVDGFDRNARAGPLDTLPFYQSCRARLARDGMMAVNLFGRRRGFRAGFERIREAFEGRATVFPSGDAGNAIAVAAVGEAVKTPLAELREHNQHLRQATGLDLRPTLSRLAASRGCAGGLLAF